MKGLGQDLAFAWRQARNASGVSLLIVVTLALAIGANTAIFSMTWHVLLAPLPCPDGNRLVVLTQHEESGTRQSFGWSSPTLQDFRKRASIIASVIGKMRDGVALDEAMSEAEVIALRLAATYPEDYPKGYAVSVSALQEEMTRGSALTVLLLTVLALLVVLIASANVANLNLVRTLGRDQELGIREALGASPNWILRQLLTESLILALAGGVLGLCIAWPCLTLLAEFATRYTPLASEIKINGAVLLFSVSLPLLVGVLSSAAFVLGGRDINKSLKEGGDKVTTAAGGVHKRNALLVVQFALSFMMLTVSALMLLSLWKLNRQDVGFDLDGILAVNMALNVDLSEPMQMEQKMRNFSRNVLVAVREIPGVQDAAIRTGAPLLQQITSATVFPFEVEGWSTADGANGPAATLNMISENYFSVMGIPLLQGRPFDANDDAEAVMVAIVNESFAGRFFPAGKAVGGYIRLRGQDDWHSVIGVVADLRSANLDEGEGPVVYLSYWQFSTEGVNLYVKHVANPSALAASIAAAVHALDSQQSLLMKPLSEVKSAWLAPTRLRAMLISLFAALALVVTLTGVVGIVSYNVRQRIREIGVHMAVGAAPSHIVSMFLAGGLKIYLVGLSVGLTLMIGVAPFLEPFLYQTVAFNPEVYLVTALLLTLAVLMAIFLPAQEAGTRSPVDALRAG